MKIGLIGYGKMGKAIHNLLPNFGHELLAKVDHNEDLSKLSSCDVAIEFTRPESAVHNIKALAEMNVPVVVGTTGWYDEFDEVSEFVEKHKGCLFYATNFSVGVNLFWAANEKLAFWINQYQEYVVSMLEIHHTQKLDSPSGTAITTAEKLIKNLNHYSGWTELPEQTEYKIPIQAKRITNVFGTHEVRFESEIDLLSIRHEAKSRDGFAKGAILAAEFIHNKTGVYTMSDLLRLS